MRHPYSTALLAVLCCSFVIATARAEDKPAAPASAPFKYVNAKAYHVPKETTTDESGYFSLVEGKNDKVYVGSASYGINSFLTEFDPKTEKMRVVLNTHKVVGLPTEPTGYAAQAKLHTRNTVGPKSGKIYVGSKQGYASPAEQERAKLGQPIPVYKGGYVLTYDPATDKAENLGMPMPLGDARLGAGETEGQGVIDVIADEDRGLIYVITCEDQHWMVLDTKSPDKGYRELQPGLRLLGQPNTIIDKSGRATAIAEQMKIARYDPATDKVTVDELMIEGKPFREYIGREVAHPDWDISADGTTAYLQTLNDVRLFKVDLTGPAGQPVQAKNLGNRVEGTNADSRGSISIAPDGRVYSMIGVANATGFGGGNLHHLVRYDPKAEKMEDLGVIKVANPDFFGHPLNNGGAKDAQGKAIPWTHGFHVLPDGALTILHCHMALIAASDGSVYATTIYPFTLLRVDVKDLQ